ncbi:MAG: zinc-ribbon domain-containing protein [Alphaproteobacteria bacterium]|nr:zinc-ribbon domain-containing protein [Alphaproteobacteria bacterium]
MILDCPHCSARYLITSAAIGAAGREVRCVKCHHEWFQEAEEEYVPSSMLEDDYDYQEEESEEIDSSFDYDEDDDQDDNEYGAESSMDDDEEDDRDYDEEEEDAQEEDHHAIPNAVKPYDEEEHVLPPHVAKIAKAKPGFQARLSGYLSAVLIFAALVGVGFAYKQKITNLWPPAAAIYDLAGLAVSFKGETLVMESLSAIVAQDDSGRDVLVLKGRVLNLTDKAAYVPMLKAVLRSTNGEDGESWIIDPPVDQLEAGGAFTFTSDYAGIPRGIGSVNLTFVPAVIGVRQANAL